MDGHINFFGDFLLLLIHRTYNLVNAGSLYSKLAKILLIIHLNMFRGDFALADYITKLCNFGKGYSESVYPIGITFHLLRLLY